MKNIFWYFLLILIVSGSVAYAEEEKFKLTGNIRNRVFYYNVNENSAFNPNNILDIPTISNNFRLELFLDNKISQSAKTHFAGRIYHSTLKIEKEYRHYLDEAYIDINFDNYMMLQTGKQRTVWGTGIAWNPSDVLNLPKDPTDPGEQKEGVLSVKLDIPTGDKWGPIQNPTFTTVFIPKVIGSEVFQSGRTQGAFKFYSLIESFDLHIISSFIESRKPLFGLVTSGVLFDVLELHGEGILHEGTERFYITNNNQITQSKIDSNRVFSKWLIGTRYTLPEDIVFLIEYYRVNEGYNDNEMQNYLNFLSNGDKSKLSLLPQRELRQNYMFVNLSKSNLWDIFNINSRILGNLDDKSFMWSPRLEYIGITNISLAMEPYFFWGNQDSEFGNALSDFFIRFEVSLYF